ncbi:hypothetical protein CHRY9390_02138 [Chryseobacterium aquaeductus]|uniref:RDD domain-containing protein n=1 Tax=Chryseobacterium aquaeductus TaxID=2675056 RepID=A0A9N8QQX6_9FLAO|nr:RDD family protein [Chryseobacterium aquaeductus]CAA7331436.1 hypothetical protein CHRY9390_02138 [Chryseobacterium potabilaquae]CAD7810193.1 hypothetical protein CHRY9390_02138 [Chryseobacterium aquaeductus]
MKKYLKIIQDNKASKGIRFANFIIDRIVVYVLFFLFGSFSYLIYELLNIEFFINVTNQLAQMNRFQDIIITLSVYLIYMFSIEYFTKGRSVGKYITGTKVIGTDGENPSFQEYLIRTVSRIVPFDGLSFFGFDGWHDAWSDTRVINIKNYNAATEVKSEIDMIGSKEIA